MEFQKNIDILLSNVTISEEMHRAIMESNPQKQKDENSGNLKRRKRPIWRQAAVPMAAALLVMSTMYVGAAYLIDHTPLRDFFTARDDSALSVPDGQQRPDIYGEILDDSFSAVGNRAEAATEADKSGTEENAVQERTQFLRGKYGEIVMDNEMFSIEMLEMTCAGRELTASYILTRKTDGNLTVHVSIDNDYMGQWKDGLAGEEYDSSRSLLRSGFGDSFCWNKLPEGCGYELAENQELCIITQLGKTDYASGTYTLYAESYLHETPVVENEREPFQIVKIPDGNIQSGFYKTSIEIVRSGDYGFALNGGLDKTEEQVHFDRYEIYVSPLTVYLMMDGTYQGEIDAIWGMCRSHDIIIGFADGTETQATVLLSAMGYDKGKIDVNMNASFETAIDPDSIVKVMLDDIVLMGE